MPEPIPCPAAEVEAMLSGRKTMLRRVIEIVAATGDRVPIYPPEELIELEGGEFASGICHYLSTGALSGPYDLPFAVGDHLSADGKPIAVVTAVKVERLQDISEADAIAEGVEIQEPGGFKVALPGGGTVHSGRAAIVYRHLWERLYGEDSFIANPWVAAVSFELIPANIDTPEAQPSGRMAREESEP